ncbi:flagellar motor switch protein FliN/FliY [Acetoanaerobium pronyense]|uniref:Flagellar motor switch protein FliN/FliY n=1 Tax=Acetoanaerobium pronyense TaxID=1482736 RepID=A0ABS4KF77_9FIRM|nr:flagellar motor switch phosphatase FliY [Acetoanaerobium pronyense]MBP2026408.1 flagellar motor switch protein FliN/FliY [Acetoanaerobium pronyense]
MRNDMLSQEEIDSLLKGGPQEEEVTKTSALNDIEIDALGEIGNINMGTAATTLFTLLGHKVQITTPSVEETTISDIASSYPIPFVSVQVNYRIGIEGMNLLILKEDDVKIITSLMLGGDGKSDIPEELNDIHLSAISEAMNQMVGSSSTSLAEMLGKKIDITPPVVSKVNLAEGGGLDPELLSAKEPIICTSFKMTIGDLIDSTIMQIMPIDFAKGLVNGMLYGSDEPEIQQELKVEEPTTMPKSPEQSAHRAESTYEREAEPEYDSYEADYESPRQDYVQQNNVRVQPASFASFDAPTKRHGSVPENIDLIKDVLLKVTVELGKTTKSIDEILQLTPGSILELDRLVGEPLDIMVNGKKIAKGEVVVIDENYGIRVTDIIKAEKRLKSI